MMEGTLEAQRIVYMKSQRPLLEHIRGGGWGVEEDEADNMAGATKKALQGRYRGRVVKGPRAISCCWAQHEGKEWKGKNLKPGGQCDCPVLSGLV